MNRYGSAQVTPEFLAQSLVNMRPRAELVDWLEGREMECPICQQPMIEGADCRRKHFDYVGELVSNELRPAR